MNKWINTNSFGFTLASEKRLVYAGFFETLGKAWEVGGKTLDVGIDALDLTSDVLGFLVELPTHVKNLGEKGWIYAKYTYKNLAYKFEKPDNPEALPEYRDIGKYFPYPPEHDPNYVVPPGEKPSKFKAPEASKAAKLHSMYAFLKMNISYGQGFMQPAIDEMKRVNDELKELRRRHIERKKRRAELEEVLIPNAKARVQTGDYLEDSGQGNDAQGSLVDLQTEYQEIKEDVSTIVEWNSPEFKDVNYPPWAKSTVSQFYSNPNKKQMIDLRDLHKGLEYYLGKKSDELNLKRYTKQLESVVFYRDEAIAGVKDQNDKILLDQYMGNVNQKLAPYEALAPQV